MTEGSTAAGVRLPDGPQGSAGAATALRRRAGSPCARRQVLALAIRLTGDLTIQPSPKRSVTMP
jgi:hypothetical protein